MSERATPLTDAAECEIIPSRDPNYCGPYLWVESHVSRQMERDRSELIEALRPFADFAAAWNRKPIRGTHDEFYRMHTGKDEGVIRLSDCQTALSFLARLDKGTK